MKLTSLFFVLAATLAAGCGKDSSEASVPAGAPAAPPPPAAATGVPECDAYLAEVERAIACPAVDEPTRASLRAEADVWRTRAASWVAMAPDARAMATMTAGDTCRTSASAARATASSFGCKR